MAILRTVVVTSTSRQGLSNIRNRIARGAFLVWYSLFMPNLRLQSNQATRPKPCLYYWDVMTTIYVDADGCPVKDEVYRVAERYKLSVILVANKRLNLPINPLLEMVVVTGAFDAADDWIVENSKPNDIVVTTDILLADRCLKKSVRALD